MVVVVVVGSERSLPRSFPAADVDVSPPWSLGKTINWKIMAREAKKDEIETRHGEEIETRVDNGGAAYLR